MDNNETKKISPEAAVAAYKAIVESGGSRHEALIALLDMGVDLDDAEDTRRCVESDSGVPEWRTRRVPDEYDTPSNADMAFSRGMDAQHDEE